MFWILWWERGVSLTEADELSNIIASIIIQSNE